MPFSDTDTAAVARALSKIADRAEDLADVFFERREEIELPPDGQTPGLRVWREAGLAVRLVRQDRTWLAGRDSISAEVLDEALRRVARAAPLASSRAPRLSGGDWPEAATAPELLEFPSLLRRALKEHHLDLKFELSLRRHRRWVMVVGPRLVSTPERESFYSLTASLPDGRRHGTLLGSLDSVAADQTARNLAQLSQALGVTPPTAWKGPCVLGSSATAVFLHEAVAHALEADTLALGGRPEAAIGVSMGEPGLNILDDPASGPDGVRRKFDDEGFPVLRRWLLRDGKVEQPICDSAWARPSEILAAGAGRRGNRHLPPRPRSTHLELMPGALSQQELMADADGGLYLSQASRGHLDPLSGQFALFFPYGRRIQNQVAGDLIGPCMLKGQVADLLGGVKGIGRESRAGGAGWCAKEGIKLPVWATTPEIRLEGLEVLPA